MSFTVEWSIRTFGIGCPAESTITPEIVTADESKPFGLDWALSGNQHRDRSKGNKNKIPAPTTFRFLISLALFRFRNRNRHARGAANEVVRIVGRRPYKSGFHEKRNHPVHLIAHADTTAKGRMRFGIGSGNTDHIVPR